MDAFSIVSSGGPVIIVHKGWNKEPSRSANHTSSNDPGGRELPTEKAESESQPILSAQKLEFINTTSPSGYKDPKVRKLVRSHVGKSSSRRQAQSQIKKSARHRTKNSNTEAKASATVGETFPVQENVVTEIMCRLNTDLNTPSPGLDPHSQLSKIIHYISGVGKAMWPLEESLKFNPICPIGWFDWALSDPALFNAILYTTYSYANLIPGTTRNSASMVHLGKSLNLVKERLKVRELMQKPGRAMVLSEGTIAAVSCMAITEALQGNFNGWRIHMLGVKNMTDSRGGITELSNTLQLKLNRADLTGAVNSLQTPFFPTLNQPTESGLFHHLGTDSNARLEYLSQLLDSLSMEQNLSANLISMLKFSDQLSNCISSSASCSISDQSALIKIACILRYNFLRSQTYYENNSATSKINKALCIGSLLYLQTTLQEFPFATVGSKTLVQMLKECLTNPKTRYEKEDHLILWLLFIGGIEADSHDKMWFISQLSEFLKIWDIGSWDSVSAILRRLWWIEKIHEKRCKLLWSNSQL
ncbi:hypothetical protein F5884DRAFT_749455 [Xylogone sp. PMI_703]|nr:hypothetical protein F5884DRAFT_749455 [Xylogone sp. PMI_703]